MSVTLTLTAFVLSFAGAALLADRMPKRAQWIPHAILAVIAFGMFYELARYDQGYPELLYYVGFIVAPVITIFGGAAWGSRRLYGWPDLGPHPSRAALVSVAVLVAVLMGVDRKARDIPASEQALQAWVEQGASGTPPATHLGFVAPPHPQQGLDEKGMPSWGFPVGNGVWRMLRIDGLKWTTSKVAPRPGTQP